MKGFLYNAFLQNKYGEQKWLISQLLVIWHYTVELICFILKQFLCEIMNEINISVLYFVEIYLVFVFVCLFVCLFICFTFLMYKLSDHEFHCKWVFFSLRIHFTSSFACNHNIYHERWLILSIRFMEYHLVLSCKIKSRRFIVCIDRRQ